MIESVAKIMPWLIEVLRKLGACRNRELWFPRFWSRGARWSRRINPLRVVLGVRQDSRRQADRPKPLPRRSRSESRILCDEFSCSHLHVSWSPQSKFRSSCPQWGCSCIFFSRAFDSKTRDKEFTAISIHAWLERKYSLDPLHYFEPCHSLSELAVVRRNN